MCQYGMYDFYQDRDDDDDDLITSVELICMFGFFMLIGCDIFVLYRFGSRQGKIKYAHSIADLWSDLLFALVLYLQQDAFTHKLISNIYLFALAFVIGPYLLSFVACIYWIRKWRKWDWKQDYSVTQNLMRQKSGCIIIMLTILSNFYNAADLCHDHSKNVSKSFIHLSLKKNKFNVLNRWKLMNILLLEVCLFILLI